MNDNIDKNDIRRAIDRLQAEHPCGIAYDPAAFVNMEAVNLIKEGVDRIAKRMAEDTEINIICEFAKLYLDGVRPVVERKFSKWKVNLNEWIKVKLNDKGKDIYYHQYDATNRRIEMLGGKKIEPSMPKVDAEGYTQFQMWKFVELYGEHFEAFAFGGGILESLDIIIMGGEPVEEGDPDATVQ